MAECFFDRERAVHKRLTDIGVGGFGSILVVDRLYPVLDRLYLRAEGEPDCADLVGKINEVCDYEGIGEGSPVERVEALAGRCREAASELKRQVIRADLKAERAQHAAKAKPVATDAVKLALLVLSDGQAWSDECRAAAVAVIREAFA